jgi:sugar phosphate isomerase/epimerase
MNRRQFGQLTGLAALGLATRSLPGASPVPAKRPPVHFFSKHLQFLDYEAMSEAAAEIGFDGLELSVRPRGHVEPENVKRDLPRAVKAMKAHGLKPLMMATSLANSESPFVEEVLKTAADEGLGYYRLSYYDFEKGETWKQCLDRARTEFAALAKLNERYGLHGAYQNHAGDHVGSYISDVAYLLDGTDVRWQGAQYDIRHATVEGGTAWPLGLRLLKNHIRTIVVKDFRWEETEAGLKVVNVPLGEGVVDFKRYFKLLREYGIDPIVSMHAEFELGGAEKGNRTAAWSKDKILASYRQELQAYHRLWDESFA